MNGIWSFSRETISDPVYSCVTLRLTPRYPTRRKELGASDKRLLFSRLLCCRLPGLLSYEEGARAARHTRFCVCVCVCVKAVWIKHPTSPSASTDYSRCLRPLWASLFIAYTGTAPDERTGGAAALGRQGLPVALGCGQDPAGTGYHCSEAQTPSVESVLSSLSFSSLSPSLSLSLSPSLSLSLSLPPPLSLPLSMRD
jgi:hypothetical protein